MIKKINSCYELKAEFANFDRDYFSLDGYSFILDMFEEDTPLDVIGICCDFSEYGLSGACLDFSDFVKDYSDYYPLDDFMENNAGYICGLDDDSIYEKWVHAIADTIGAVTLENGNIFV